MRFGILAVGGLLLVACSSDLSPQDTYSHYLELLVSGDVESAWALLSASSRDRLARAERTWRSGGQDDLAPTGEAAPPSEDVEGFALFRRLVAGPGFHGVPPLPSSAPAAITGARVDGDTAYISVDTPEGPGEARLVREDDVWRVALF